MTSIDEVLKDFEPLPIEELERRVAERITFLPDSYAQHNYTQLINMITDNQLDEHMMQHLEDADSEMDLGSDIGHLLSWMQDTVDMDNPGDHWAMIVLCKILGLWGHQIDE